MNWPAGFRRYVTAGLVFLASLGGGCQGSLLTESEGRQRDSSSSVGPRPSRTEKPSQGDLETLRAQLHRASKTARQACAELEQEDCRALQQGIRDAEGALKAYQKQAEREHVVLKRRAPLLLAGAAIIGDDVTGVGVADDPLLVVVAVAALGSYFTSQTADPTLGPSAQALVVQLSELEQQARTLLMAKAGRSKNRDAAEHTKNARPSTQEKHERGQERKQRDQGGEKGDTRRPYQR